MNTATLVRLLEEDPAEALRQPEAFTPEVFDAWIRRCSELVDSNPREGLPYVDTALVIATSTCQTVQCLGVTAAAHRALGDLDMALGLLEQAFRMVRGCPACLADLLRRRALVNAAAGNASLALVDADASICAYEGLACPDHDLLGFGLASALLARGDIRQYFGMAAKSAELLSGSIEDSSQALTLAVPQTYPLIHRAALFNLSLPLFASRTLPNLLTADKHIQTVRQRFFKPVGYEPSRERALLDWATAMVRFELRRFPGKHRKVKPYRLRKMLYRALKAFIYVGMPAESSAVASDLSLVQWQDRAAVLAVIAAVLDRVRERRSFFAPEVRASFGPIHRALLALQRAAGRDVVGVSADEVDAGIKRAITELRLTCAETCEMLPCLLSWPK